jgi:acetylornithine deacetylase
MQTTEEILRTLVAIPSVSNLSNGPLLDAIEALLKPLDWQTQRLPYVAADGVEKANMLAFPRRFRDALPEVELLFVCHTDTVPFRKEWMAATQLAEMDGQLHGCGSCDVKGSLAGLLSAAQQVEAEKFSVPIAFAFTAEEEIGCIGATKLVASGAIRPRQVIVCEPTSLHPATAGKGYGLAEVRVLGHEAHSAFPEKGASAINMAAQIIVKLEQWQKTSERARDSRFNPPTTTFNVGVLRGGTAKNIVAGECTFLVEWRPVPSEDPRLGGEIVQGLAAEMASMHPQFAIDVQILRADAGFANDSSSRLGPALSRMLGRPETGISFGSEATRFAALAKEAVVIGPGDMETAHSERECVPRRELEEWTEVVKHLLLHGLSV